MGNVLRSVKISFKNKAHAHRVPSHGGCVHGGPEGVLKEHGGKEDTESLKYHVKQETRRASRRDDGLQS